MNEAYARLLSAQQREPIQNRRGYLIRTIHNLIVDAGRAARHCVVFSSDTADHFDRFPLKAVAILSQATTRRKSEVVQLMSRLPSQVHIVRYRVRDGWGSRPSVTDSGSPRTKPRNSFTKPCERS